MATQGTGHAALLVVDMQRWLRSVVEEVLPNINGTISDLRRAGIPVIFTQQGVKDPEAEKEKSIFVRKVGVTACPRVGELGWELVPGLDTDPELDLFITSRDTYDAFYNTGLLHILTELQVDTVIICGVMTHTSCETTARSAFTQNFQVLVCSDGTAAGDLEAHENSLRNLRYGFADVVTCRVARGRFQKSWIEGHLARRQLSASYHLPPGIKPPPGLIRPRSLRDRKSEGREWNHHRPASTGSESPVEKEGWWLMERRGEIMRERAGQEGMNLFDRIASARPGAVSCRGPGNGMGSRAARARDLESARESSSHRTEEHGRSPEASEEAQGGAGQQGADERRAEGRGPRREAPWRGTGPAVFYFSSNVTEEERKGMMPVRTSQALAETEADVEPETGRRGEDRGAGPTLEEPHQDSSRVSSPRGVAEENEDAPNLESPRDYQELQLTLPPLSPPSSKHVRPDAPLPPAASFLPPIPSPGLAEDTIRGPLSERLEGPLNESEAQFSRKAVLTAREDPRPAATRPPPPSRLGVSQSPCASQSPRSPSWPPPPPDPPPPGPPPPPPRAPPPPGPTHLPPGRVPPFHPTESDSHTRRESSSSSDPPPPAAPPGTVSFTRPLSSSRRKRPVVQRRQSPSPEPDPDSSSRIV